MIYTSLNTKDSVLITDAFEKKYGIKVSLWRAGSEKVLNRAVTEARAGRHSPDILETMVRKREAMHREKLLAEFYSPAFKHIRRSPFRRHPHYVADRFAFSWWRRQHQPGQAGRGARQL